MRKHLLTALGAGAIILSIAGCSAADDVESTPRPTTTQTPDAAYEAPTGECQDGEATITKDLETIDLPDGCDIVNVLTNASTITLGPVKQLNIEGENNTVTVESATKIGIYGEDNTVTHGGDAKVIDNGDTNKVTKR